MRSVAVVAAIASLGGCFQSRTVDCGDGFLCPADQVCAAPGHCGEPALVEKCDDKAAWDPCEFSDTAPGSCRFGVCEACTPDRVGCATGWRAMSPPTTTDLNAVWVFDRADAYAAGNGGVLLHYDGTEWSAVTTSPPIPTDLDLVSIWGDSGDNLYLVSSDGGDRNVLHITNRTALAFEMMPSYGLKAVWGTAPDSVYAVGLGGTIRRFDGTAWQEVATGGPPLAKIHGASDTRAFAIGPSGTYARLDGSQWTTAMINAGAVLTNVWVSDTEAFVVGESRTLLRLADTAWQPVTFDATVPAGIDLYAAWGEGDQLYVVGEAGKVIRSTNGTEWTDASPGLGSAALRAIHGSSASNLIVVGAGGAIWRYSGD